MQAHKNDNGMDSLFFRKIIFEEILIGITSNNHFFSALYFQALVQEKN